MAIDHYYVPFSAPCRSVLLVADALGLELNNKFLDLMSGEHLKPEFLKINPQHTVPTIVDDGFALWESRAILTYLVNKYAPGHSLYPSDVQKRAQVDRALNFDGCSLYPSFGAVVYPMIHQQTPFNPTAAVPLYQRLEILDNLLANNNYVAGDELTLADLATLTTITSIFAIPFLETDKYSNIKAWIERLHPQIKTWDTTVVEYANKFGEFVVSKTKKE